MLQIFQHQKTGEIVIEELPTPKCFPGGILVETQCSLISAGTEKTSVASAKLSLLERVIHQPEQVKLVLDFIKKEGVYSTAQRVMRQLDSYKGFGYSAAGIVVESDCEEFSVGDRVAIAGAGYANHAEINSVPKNLAVKIPETVGLDVAAFTTVATIALQGIRQAAPEIGENVAVIGLGLIGQITVQLLRAGGQSVVGFDIDENTFELAKQNGCQAVFPSSKEYIKDAIYKTQNLGFDKVIITASTSSDEPIELAIELARKRGIIVVVGAVPMNIQRGKFYQKELELKISTSYGPGRYDPFYEEVGRDYPYAYVRWTEQRNM
ncbi:MAG TPA: oxidoreductase, partial [Bacteroidetes bacterium]|nr:oxidoreductase [Bacteroidota bacterium]